MLIIGVLSSFLLDWLAVALDWRKIKPFSKVLAMLMVIAWTLTMASWNLNNLIWILLMAQVFGLAGDIFLLLSDRWFMGGLGAFLIGHLFYIGLILLSLTSRFGVDLSSTSLAVPVIISGILWGGVLWIIYRIFKKDYFFQHSNGQLLWFLVQIYIWILSGLMVLTFFRIMVQPEINIAMLLLPVGGVLFLISDSILAYNRFIKPIPQGQVWVHVTYHLAQFSLAAGFLGILGII